MSSNVRAWARRASVWWTGWVLSAALYLLLIDTTDLPELLVGAGAAAIAATGFGLARERYLAAQTFRLGWLPRLYRPFVKVPADVALVSWAALMGLASLASPASRQPVRGEFRAVPFHCGDDEALEIGRRALAESLGSFAPNTIIIGVDPERELLLGHQLRRTGGAEAIDVLGLG
jgi:hypothetical protein